MNLQNCKICKKEFLEMAPNVGSKQKYAQINVSRDNHTMCIKSMTFKKNKQIFLNDAQR